MIFATKINQINISILVLLALLVPTLNVKAANGEVVISQLQTGAASSASQEYISIFNNSDLPVDITNWCVVYASYSDVTQTQLGCLTAPNLNTKLFLPARSNLVLATSEFLNAQPYYTADLVFSSGISGTSGHIKLVDASKTIIDKLGWGASINPETKSASAPPSGKVLKRLTLASNQLKDTNDNYADFTSADLVLPDSNNIYEEYSEPLPAGPTAILTELMPDAKGADAGKEFIEFHNPHTGPISLSGYFLQVGPSYSKSYFLPDIVLEAKTYLALSDSQTGITLPNTSASVKLLAPNGQVVSQTETYNQPGEDVSWALFADTWQATYVPTPGSSNLLLEAKLCPEGQDRSDLTGYCKNESSTESASGLTPCRPDQQRNAITNRCRKISSLAASLLPCKAGQARNLATGRCRSITKALTGKQPCKAGQIRNAQTNRCRKIASASTKKPCAADQERNPKTGRCKKSTGRSKLNKVKDIQTGLLANNAKWWAAGVAAVGSAVYAVYEWRREAWLILEALKDKII